MTLQARLDAHKARFEEKAPAEALEVMRRSTAALAASGQAERAMTVGDRAPSFTLPGQDGTPVRSRDLLGRGPLVISFYRGVWCPYCNLELQALQEWLPDIVAVGAALVAISPQTGANSRKAVREHGLTFPILSDWRNEVAAMFGLRYRLPEDLINLYKGFGNDLAVANGEPSWTLPMPARFVVAPDGTIAYAEVNADYTRRPEPMALLPVLRKLMTGRTQEATAGLPGRN